MRLSDIIIFMQAYCPSKYCHLNVLETEGFREHDLDHMVQLMLLTRRVDHRGYVQYRLRISRIYNPVRTEKHITIFSWTNKLNREKAYREKAKTAKRTINREAA